MVLSQARSKRKPTGGRYSSSLAKKNSRKGNLPALTRIEDRIRKKTIRTRGGSLKKVLLATNKANVYDPSSKKYVVAEVQEVVENAADSQFVRRNIITKGAIINTSQGKAKVTNRPGQDGFINAVLIVDQK